MATKRRVPRLAAAVRAHAGTAPNINPRRRAATNYTYNLGRTDGNQYLSQVKTVLPPGLVGQIPLAQCGETQANEGTCPSASRSAPPRCRPGSGAKPYTFSGPVFLTGPYHGAPFGLSISVPAVAGPFNLGNVVTRRIDVSTRALHA